MILKVSILVLMELGLERKDKEDYPSATTGVSILVLMELGLEQIDC